MTNNEVKGPERNEDDSQCYISISTTETQQPQALSALLYSLGLPCGSLQSAGIQVRLTHLARHRLGMEEERQ